MLIFFDLVILCSVFIILGVGLLLYMLLYNLCVFLLVIMFGEIISIIENNIFLVNMYIFMFLLLYIFIIINY